MTDPCVTPREDVQPREKALRALTLTVYAGVTAYALRSRTPGRLWGIFLCMAVFAMALYTSERYHPGALNENLSHFTITSLLGWFFPDNDDEFDLAQVVYEAVVHVNQDHETSAQVQKDMHFRAVKICTNISGYYLGRELRSYYI